MQAQIGTVSHGRLREQDLLTAFARELERLAGCPVYPTTVAYERANREELAGDEEFIISELAAALQDYAPPYCYFGALEGDGSDFGFWPDHDAIQEAIENGERDPEDNETVINGDDGMRIHVSDHGNIEVYSIETGESLLAIV